jgi:hypothetical protein
MDCRLNLEKPRGFFAKQPGIIDFRIIFVKKKLWTQSTGHGPRSVSIHGGPTLYGDIELIGARPPAAPVHKGAGQGAGEEEGVWGTHFGPHRRSSGDEVAERRW